MLRCDRAILACLCNFTSMKSSGPVFSDVLRSTTGDDGAEGLGFTGPETCLQEECNSTV